MKYPVITPEERRQRLEPPRKKSTLSLIQIHIMKLMISLQFHMQCFHQKKYRWKQSMQPLFPQISLLG